MAYGGKRKEDVQIGYTWATAMTLMVLFFCITVIMVVPKVTESNNHAKVRTEEIKTLRK